MKKPWTNSASYVIINLVIIVYDMKKLKELRKENKYTIYDMARKLRITPSFYCQIENKKRRLFYDTAIKISGIFNMKPDDIFYTNNY